MNSINHKVKKTALGQIVAVVAAIFVAYISFMGLVYLTHGRLELSALAALAIGMAWVLLCFMAQQMKGTESKFASCWLLPFPFSTSSPWQPATGRSHDSLMRPWPKSCRCLMSTTALPTSGLPTTGNG